MQAVMEQEVDHGKVGKNNFWKARSVTHRQMREQIDVIAWTKSLKISHLFHLEVPRISKGHLELLRQNTSFTIASVIILDR